MIFYLKKKLIILNFFFKSFYVNINFMKNFFLKFESFIKFKNKEKKIYF
jgi:hypothetical protein